MRDECEQTDRLNQELRVNYFQSSSSVLMESISSSSFRISAGPWPIKLQSLCASPGNEWQLDASWGYLPREGFILWKSLRGDQIQKLLVGCVTFQKNTELAQAFDIVWPNLCEKTRGMRPPLRLFASLSYVHAAWTQSRHLLDSLVML